MVVDSIDAYLADIGEPDRSVLLQLRSMITAAAPGAQEAISYGLPAFTIGGKVIAGFGAFTHHLSYLPHSGGVLPKLAADIAGYTATKSALHFTAAHPLPKALVKKLVDTRIQELKLQ